MIYDNSLIKIINDGDEILYTNYWETPHAVEGGLMYLSGRRGVWRLLVPDCNVDFLNKIRPAKSAIIEESFLGPYCWDVIFCDGGRTYCYVTLHQRQIDLALEKGKCRLAVWTSKGKFFEIDLVVNECSYPIGDYLIPY